MKRLVFVCTLSLVPTFAVASPQPDEGGLRQRRTTYIAPPRNMGPIADLRHREEQVPDCGSGGLFSALGDMFGSFTFKNVFWPILDSDDESSHDAGFADQGGQIQARESDSEDDVASSDSLNRSRGLLLNRLQMIAFDENAEGSDLVLDEEGTEMITMSTSDSRSNKRRRSDSSDKLPEVTGPSEEESKPEVQDDTYYPPIEPVIVLNFPWDDDDEDEVDEVTIEAFFGKSETPQPQEVSVKETAEADTPVAEEDSPSILVDNDVQLAPEIEVLAVDELEAYRRFLAENANMSSKKLLENVDSEAKCALLFESLDKRSRETGLNFKGAHPFVVREFLRYLQVHPRSFIGLRALLCGGHNLDPAETALLLKTMGDGSRGNTGGGSGKIFIELTPDKSVDPAILVALAARFSDKLDTLNLSINVDDLPAGYDELMPHERFILNVKSTHEDDLKLRQMESIIKDDEAKIEYGDQKVLVLK